jgi:6-phosphogluconate dehydrogenase
MRIKLSCCPLYQDLKKLNDDQKHWAKMEMLTTMRKAKNMAFQPQYAQCFIVTTSLPQTYDYNLQYQDISTVSNIQNK